MAAPTTSYERGGGKGWSLYVTGTNVDAGNNDYVVEHSEVPFANGFSIQTGTLTAMTVTILADNGLGYVDVTGELFQVSGVPVTSLSANSMYMWTAPIPAKRIKIRAARSNATNAVNLWININK